MTKQSLFEISQEYQQLIWEIEDNGGELTPELEEALAVTDNNFREKLSNYRKLVASIESDVAACKEEAERIMSIRKTKENTVKRLKGTMLEAVLQFGDNGKSGNKVVELSDCKLFTRNSRILELDEEKYNLLVESFMAWAKDLWDNGMLDTSSDISGSINITDAVGIINSMLHDKRAIPEDFYYTEDDLQAIRVKIETEKSLAQLLMTSNFTVLDNYFAQETDSNITKSLNKPSVKGLIESGFAKISFAEVVVNPSLQIK